MLMVEGPKPFEAALTSISKSLPFYFVSLLYSYCFCSVHSLSPRLRVFFKLLSACDSAVTSTCWQRSGSRHLSLGTLRLTPKEAANIRMTVPTSLKFSFPLNGREDGEEQGKGLAVKFNGFKPWPGCFALNAEPTRKELNRLFKAATWQ